MRDFFSKCVRPNPQETADLVTFTEEILNGKLHFLCSDIKLQQTYFFQRYSYGTIANR